MRPLPLARGTSVWQITPQERCQPGFGQVALVRREEIDNAFNGLWCGRGVAGGQNQVAGLRHRQGSGSGVRIPDLADHDNIGVLP